MSESVVGVCGAGARAPADVLEAAEVIDDPTEALAYVLEAAAGGAGARAPADVLEAAEVIDDPTEALAYVGLGIMNFWMEQGQSIALRTVL